MGTLGRPQGLVRDVKTLLFIDGAMIFLAAITPVGRTSELRRARSFINLYKLETHRVTEVVPLESSRAQCGLSGEIGFSEPTGSRSTTPPGQLRCSARASAGTPAKVRTRVTRDQRLILQASCPKVL